LLSLLTQPGHHGDMVDSVATISLSPFYHTARKTASGLDFHLSVEKMRENTTLHVCGNAATVIRKPLRPVGILDWWVMS